jgi:antitoxin PrlF
MRIDSGFDFSKLSSKGQVVIPESIRDKMRLQEGTKFMVFCDNNTIFLKPVRPSASQIDQLFKKAEAAALQAGLTEEDVEEAILDYRKGKKR